MPISIDEVITDIAPPPAPTSDAAAPAVADPVAPDPVALTHLLVQLAWRAARVAAD